MSEKVTHDWRRPLIFLAVLMSHVVLVIFVIRARQFIFLPTETNEPLILIHLHDRAAAASATDIVKPSSPAPSPAAAASSPTVITVPPEAPHQPLEAPRQPTIDWEHEAQLAAQNAIADAEKQKSYRDLSALSPEQLSWIKKNHMEPMPPGIPWNHPRVEFTKDGLPFIWINDHCVYIPVMLVMVFCRIGHIEPNGDLFKHCAIGTPRER